MAKFSYEHGSTSVILRVKIPDSTKTDGSGLTGLTFASSGLIISTIADVEAAKTVYTQAASTTEDITTLGTYAAPTATKCRFKEVDATNHPGVYEIHLADPRYAVTNARSLIVSISGATNAAQVDAEIQLEPVPANVTKWRGAVPNALVSARVDTLVGSMGPSVLTSTAIANAAISAAKIGTAALTNAKISVNFIDAIRDGILDDATRFSGANIAPILADTADMQPKLGSPAGSSLAADLADVPTVAEFNARTIAAANYALEASVQAIQNNTRTHVSLMPVMERPDSSNTRFKIYLNNYDTVGNMEAPDSAPTVAVANESGTTRSGNLQHPTTHVPQTTMVLVSTGRYLIEYELDSADTSPEQLNFTFTIIEGGATRQIDRGVQVVDTTAVDFTSADRTKLDTLHDTRCTEVRMAELGAANLPTDVDTLLSRLSAARALLLDEITALRLAELDAGNLPASVDAILVDTGTTLDAAIAALNDLSTADILAAIFEDSSTSVSKTNDFTIGDLLKLALAVLAGITSNGGATFKTPNGTLDRVLATTNASDERTVMDLKV